MHGPFIENSMLEHNVGKVQMQIDIIMQLIRFQSSGPGRTVGPSYPPGGSGWIGISWVH